MAPFSNDIDYHRMVSKYVQINAIKQLVNCTVELVCIESDHVEKQSVS